MIDVPTVPFGVVTKATDVIARQSIRSDVLDAGNPIEIEIDTETRREKDEFPNTLHQTRARRPTPSKGLNQRIIVDKETDFASCERR